MMTACASPAHDVYDPDAVVPRNSPLLVAKKVNTRPTPSPPPDIPLVQVSTPPSPGSGKAKRRSKVRPSQGDAVLIGMMDNGRHPDIATQAGQQPLPSDSEEMSSSPESESSIDDDEVRSTTVDLDADIVDIRRNGSASLEPPSVLKMLAGNALATLALGDQTSGSDGDRMPTTVPDTDADVPRPIGLPASSAPRPQTAVRRDDRPHPVIPAPYSPSGFYSPRTGSFASPTGSNIGGELPPIQNASPRSDSNAGISLPSLMDQLGPSALSPGAFQTSPPGPGHARRLGSMSHTSPPISPPDGVFPHSPRPIMSPRFYAYPPTGLPHRPSVDFNGSTPSDQSVSTPATSTSVADRMSIDGVAFSNPAEIGQYICKVEGCKAPPFQTQYLLNSHANVHSQARPHYCPVKGCPRSEGGKGFKRKNEMIRHGLVHDSPGYVCPFCPDREHKYPRPDNLQR